MRLLLSMILFFSIFAKAQTWQPIGPDYKKEFGFGFNLSKLFQYSDTLYAAMTVHDESFQADTFRAIIKRFNGSDWDTIGIPFSVGVFNGTDPEHMPSITLSPNHSI